jgi:hypothetical protein
MTEMTELAKIYEAHNGYVKAYLGENGSWRNEEPLAQIETESVFARLLIAMYDLGVSISMRRNYGQLIEKMLEDAFMAGVRHGKHQEVPSLNREGISVTG